MIQDSSAKANRGIRELLEVPDDAPQTRQMYLTWRAPEATKRHNCNRNVELAQRDGPLKSNYQPLVLLNVILQ
jgi:hypothetical protein